MPHRSCLAAATRGWETCGNSSPHRRHSDGARIPRQCLGIISSHHHRKPRHTYDSEWGDLPPCPYTIQAHLVLLCFALLHFTDTGFFTNWSFVPNLCQASLSKGICPLHISVSQFGNSLNISNVFIIIFVTVTCGQ